MGSAKDMQNKINEQMPILDGKLGRAKKGIDELSKIEEGLAKTSKQHIKTLEGIKAVVENVSEQLGDEEFNSSLDALRSTERVGSSV